MHSGGLHHLSSWKNAPTFPPRWRKAIDLVIHVIAVAAPFVYAPQAFKIYSEQDASGLAISTFVLLFFINAAWLLYGWAHRSFPMVIMSVLFCAFHVVIVTGIILFSA